MKREEPIVTQPNETPRLELTASVAVPILVALFRQSDQWKTKALTKELIQVHADRGGVPGTQFPWQITKKALQMLRKRGLVMSPAAHTWIRTGAALDRLDGRAPPAALQNESGAGRDTSLSEDDSVELTSDPPLWNTMAIEAEVGDGHGAVYVYFSDTDRELAMLKHQIRWRCKIGYALDGNPRRRIMGQALHTAMSRMPTIGLVIRTDHGKTIERLLHRGLHAAGRRALDSPGAEWFETSPDEIKKWHKHIEEAMRMFTPIDVADETSSDHG